MKVTINISGYGQGVYDFYTLPSRGESLYVNQFVCRNGDIKDFRCQVNTILHNVSHLDHEIVIICVGLETEKKPL